jgi:hypothetical protein
MKDISQRFILNSKINARKNSNKSILNEIFIIRSKRIKDMKKSINTTNLLVALFTTSLFSTVVAANVQQKSLVKIEPINQYHLTTAAHNSLKITLAPVKINYTYHPVNNNLAKQKQTVNQNESVTLTKISLVAEE